MKFARFFSALSLAVLLASAGVITLTGQRGRDKNEQTAPLTFRFVGPAVGNRVASIAGIPGDPTTYYAGAASGGVWKTTDSGHKWIPVSDSMPVQAIGAMMRTGYLSPSKRRRKRLNGALFG